METTLQLYFTYGVHTDDGIKDVERLIKCTFEYEEINSINESKIKKLIAETAVNEILQVMESFNDYWTETNIKSIKLNYDNLLKSFKNDIEFNLTRNTTHYNRVYKTITVDPIYKKTRKGVK